MSSDCVEAIKSNSTGISSAMELAAILHQGLDQDWDLTDGLHRPGYSDQETNAIRIIVAKAKEMGGKPYQDLAGNVHILFSGNPKTRKNLKTVMMGSHPDGVPQGGRYDGITGIVAGLSAIKLAQESGLEFPQDVILTAFRAEESAWWNNGAACIGSKLMVGDLTSDFLKKASHITDKKTLCYHMTNVGVDTYGLRKALDAKRAIFPIEHIGQYLEAHIEQGPALLDADKSLGVVTSIFGNVRFPKGITFVGEASHSGATPQHMRKDAGLIEAYFTVAWDEAMQKLSDGVNFVHAIVDKEVPNASSTSVSGKCILQMEVRSSEHELMQCAKEQTIQLVEEVKKKWGVDILIDAKDIKITSPAALDSEMHDKLMKLTEKFGFDVQSMPSGAGHDAGILANAGVPSSMIFIRHGNKGISHNPKEIMALSEGGNPFDAKGDFSHATSLMAASLVTPQQSKDKPSCFENAMLSCDIKEFNF